MQFENTNIILKNALYIISTPIGDMSDITIKALNIINKVDYLFCEDTRVTNCILKYYCMEKKSLFVYNDFSQNNEREKIIKLLEKGCSVGLVSDAGTPLISDPGFKLVAQCKQKGITVIPICGASAILASLVASGLPTDKFLFYGFLPEKENERKKELKKLQFRKETIIFYESPKRFLFSLNEIYNIIGNCEICVAKELTKTFEDIRTESISNMINYYQNNLNKIRGEFVLIIKNNISVDTEINIERIKLIYDNLQLFMKPKEIANFITKIEKNIEKKEIYDLLLSFKK